MKKFTKKIENFICDNCKNMVTGNGYTNHCPKCFYSKHVDINPGDRSSNCLGLMKPIGYDINSKKGISVIHRCIKCMMTKKNKIMYDEEVISLLQAIQK